MVFSSLIFLYAFLPLSLAVYALCRSLRAKNISLLVFSLIFYAWGEPVYVLLLMAMALFDWYFALRVQRAQREEKNAKLWVALACVVNLGLIGFFKYAGMVCSIFGDVPAFVQRIALPLGISFYTFQLLSYVVDVYRGDAEAQDKYWHVLLYAALFHQCIAGPIVRYKTIAKELFDGRDETADRARGCTRFAVGLAKKTVLANACGALADSLLLTDAAIGSASQLAENLAALSNTPALALWIGMIAYAFQIYFDFSAYSDMAIGMGLIRRAGMVDLVKVHAVQIAWLIRYRVRLIEKRRALRCSGGDHRRNALARGVEESDLVERDLSCRALKCCISRMHSGGLRAPGKHGRVFLRILRR